MHFIKYYLFFGFPTCPFSTSSSSSSTILGNFFRSYFRMLFSFEMLAFYTIPTLSFRLLTVYILFSWNCCCSNPNCLQHFKCCSVQNLLWFFSSRALFTISIKKQLELFYCVYVYRIRCRLQQEETVIQGKREKLFLNALYLQTIAREWVWAYRKKHNSFHTQYGKCWHRCKRNGM